MDVTAYEAVILCFLYGKPLRNSSAWRHMALNEIITVRDSEIFIAIILTSIEFLLFLHVFVVQAGAQNH